MRRIFLVFLSLALGVHASAAADLDEPLFTLGPVSQSRVVPGGRLHPIQVDEDAALRSIFSGRLQVPTPSGWETFNYVRHEIHANGDWTWVGRPDGGWIGQEAVLTFNAEGASGSIPAQVGAPLRLVIREGRSWLLDMPAARPLRRAGTPLEPRQDYLVPPRNVQSVLAAKIFAEAQPVATPTPIVDVLVAYTPGFAGSASGGALTRINNLVAITNQAYQNSVINARVRLVGTVQVNYPDNTNNATALEEITGGDVPVPPSLSQVAALRNQYGADLVVFIRKFSDPENEGCGIAWLIGGNQTPIDPDLDAPFGYSVVSDGQDGDFFCLDETFAHELGHNMGSNHDVENSGGDSGRYPYSYGYKAGSGADGFSTVMAYGDDDQTPLKVFSNPNILCLGSPCGVANEADNARSLAQTVPIVSTFRATAVPLESATKKDVNADHKTDLLFRYSSGSARKFGYWIMNGADVMRTWSVTTGQSYSVAATGDFDGDGDLDIAWTSSARDVKIWFGSGASFSGSHHAGTYPADWTLFGAGDINGDGKSDLLLRYSSGNVRKLGYWIMNGADVVRTWSVETGLSYSVAATGDFNGDRKLDITWTSGARDVKIWFGNGTSFSSSQYAGSYEAGWTIIPDTR